MLLLTCEAADAFVVARRCWDSTAGPSWDCWTPVLSREAAKKHSSHASQKNARPNGRSTDPWPDDLKYFLRTTRAKNVLRRDYQSHDLLRRGRLVRHRFEALPGQKARRGGSSPNGLRISWPENASMNGTLLSRGVDVQRTRSRVELYFHETSAHTPASKLCEPLGLVAGFPGRVLTLA